MTCPRMHMLTTARSAGELIASDDLPLHAYAHHGALSLPTLPVQAEAAAVAAEVEAEVAQVSLVNCLLMTS